MLRARRVVLVLTLLAGLAVRVSAQICGGNASFAGSPIKLGGSLDFSSSVTRFGGHAAFGSTGVFGVANVGFGSFDGGGSSFSVGGTGGYQVSVKAKRPVQICPLVSVGFTSGPDAGDINVSSRAFSGAGAVGIELGSSPKFKLVPNGAFGIAHTRTKLDDGTTSVTGSDTYEFFELAMGFVFSNRIAVIPHVLFPIGLDDSETSFGVRVSIGLKKS